RGRAGRRDASSLLPPPPGDQRQAGQEGHRSDRGQGGGGRRTAVVGLPIAAVDGDGPAVGLAIAPPSLGVVYGEPHPPVHLVAAVSGTGAGPGDVAGPCDLGGGQVLVDPVTGVEGGGQEVEL